MTRNLTIRIAQAAGRRRRRVSDLAQDRNFDSVAVKNRFGSRSVLEFCRQKLGNALVIPRALYRQITVSARFSW
jgi:hypothetical protein